MKIETRKQQNVTIVAPSGGLVKGVATSALRKAVGEALEAGARNILVNLGGVSTIDTSGIGELMSCRKVTVGRGGKFKLCSMPANLGSLRRTDQLLSGLEAYDDEIDAIGSF